MAYNLVAEGEITASVEEFRQGHWIVDLLGPVVLYPKMLPEGMNRLFHVEKFDRSVTWSSGICGEIEWHGMAVYRTRNCGFLKWDAGAVFTQMFREPFKVYHSDNLTVNFDNVVLSHDDVPIGALFGKKLYRSIDSPWRVIYGNQADVDRAVP